MATSGAADAAAAPAPSTRRKSRRPTVVFCFCFIAVSFPEVRVPSRRQRERLAFDFDEHAPQCADAGVKLRRLGMLQIAEETPHPRPHALLENLAIAARRRRKAAVDEARHDLAEDRNMILRLRVALHALDAERQEVLAQARERTLVQESGKIVGAVRHKLAAAQSDEEI